jgi:hypothetical protein
VADAFRQGRVKETRGEHSLRRKYAPDKDTGMAASESGTILARITSASSFSTPSLSVGYAAGVMLYEAAVYASTSAMGGEGWLQIISPFLNVLTSSASLFVGYREFLERRG